MHYENGQIIYYLHTGLWGHQRVLKLEVKLPTPPSATTRNKGIVLNHDWNKDKLGAFLWLDELDQGLISTSPIEPIAESYRRKVEEVNKEIEPLLTKTIKEYEHTNRATEN